MTLKQKDVEEKLQAIDELTIFFQEKIKSLEDLWQGVDTFKDRELRTECEQHITESLNRLKESRNKLLKLVRTTVEK